MIRGRGGHCFLAGTAALACAVSTQASAQAVESEEAGVAEIVVTAQRRSESLQDVPVSVAAVTGDALRAAGTANIGDLARLTPSVQIKSTFADSSPIIFIRGVGINDFNANAPGGVGVYVDDVYAGLSIGRLFQFFDAERVEVLRGPQGTLFGRNATGGAISFISAKPGNTSEGSFTAEYGRFNEVLLEGAIGGPIVGDTVRARAAVSYRRRDGLVLNRVDGRRDGTSYDRLGYRVLADWVPSADFSLLVNVHGGRSNNQGNLQHRGLFAASANETGPDGLCLPQFYNTPECTDVLGYTDTDGDVYAGDYDGPASESVRMFGASATIKADLGGLLATSITAYEHARRRATTDEDSSPNAILDGLYIDRGRQFSQEVRLASQNSGSFSWILGGFYYDERLTSDSAFDVLRAVRPAFSAAGLPGGFARFEDAATNGGIAFQARYPYIQTTRSVAAFGQATYEFVPRLRATLGLRWSNDRVRLRYSSFYTEPNVSLAPILTDAQVDNRTSSSRVTYRVALDYKPDDNILLYGSVNSGYNSGGFNGGLSYFRDELEPFRPETLTAYEIGFKSTLFDRKLRLNAGLFYYDYKNLQVFILSQTGLPVPIKRNASAAEIYGGEIEMVAAPIRNLQVSLGAGYTQAKYKRFVDAAGDFSGNRLVGAPRLTANAAVDAGLPIRDFGRLKLHVDASYQSKVFFATTNTERLSQSPYAIVNSRLGWQSSDERFEIYAWVRNLTDQRYANEIVPLEDFGFDQIVFGDPRTFGIGAAVSF